MQNQQRKQRTYQSSTATSRQELREITRRAIRLDLIGAEGRGVLADPEAFAVSVDGLQVDGAGGAGGDEAEGCGGVLAGRDGERFGGGEEGEEGCEDEGGMHV